MAPAWASQRAGRLLRSAATELAATGAPRQLGAFLVRPEPDGRAAPPSPGWTRLADRALPRAAVRVRSVPAAAPRPTWTPREREARRPRELSACDRPGCDKAAPTGSPQR